MQLDFEKRSFEQMSVRDRILYYVDVLNVSKSKFEREAGLSNSYLNNLKDDIVPKPRIIERILDAYPNLNREWLMTGKGEMEKPLNPEVLQNVPNNQGNVVGKGNIISEPFMQEQWKKRALQLQEQKEVLEETIKSQQETIKSQQETIAILTKLRNQ